MSLKKTAKQDAPHAIFADYASGWEWRVLKVYQGPKQEAANPYARWFCAVSSPHTFGGCDLGDTYRRDVTNNARLVAATAEFVEAYRDGFHAQDGFIRGCAAGMIPEPVAYLASHSEASRMKQLATHEA